MARVVVSLLRLGAAVRDLRTAIGWTQRELGRRSGMSQSQISRFERGLLRNATVATAVRLFDVMGARLLFDVDAPFIGGRSHQRDPAHARMAAAIAAWLRRAGWEVHLEVEIGGNRSRGWIDVVAWHPDQRVRLVIEVKTEIHDLGQIQRNLGWYEREAWFVARRLGWRPLRTVGCLLLLATEANDSRALENREALVTAFPLRARELDGIVQGLAGAPGQGWAAAMVDPRSRRRAWLRPLRVDRRRSPQPYADYADFMRTTRGGRQRSPSLPRGHDMQPVHGGGQ